MKCPKCGRVIRKDTKSCAHCNAVLDKSSPGDDSTDLASEDAPPPRSQRGSAATEKSAAKQPPGGAQNYPENLRGARRFSGLVVQDATDKEAHPQRTSKPPPERTERRRRSGTRANRDPSQPGTHEERRKPRAQQTTQEGEDSHRRRRTAQDTPEEKAFAPEEDHSSRADGAQMVKDVEGTVKKALGFFGGLNLGDKLAVGGAIGVFLFSFFPWMSAPGHLISGMDLGGWFTALLAAGLATLVYLRHDPRWEERRRQLLYGQAACAGLAVLFLLSKLMSLPSVQFAGPGTGPTVLRDFMTPSIQLGLVFSLFASVGALVGTWMLYRGITRPKG